MQGYGDVCKWTILKRTSPEVKRLYPTSSRCETCTSSVSNVIYHKFPHGAAFYTLNRKNINAMLELKLKLTRKFPVAYKRKILLIHDRGFLYELKAYLIYVKVREDSFFNFFGLETSYGDICKNADPILTSRNAKASLCTIQ